MTRKKRSKKRVSKIIQTSLSQCAIKSVMSVLFRPITEKVRSAWYLIVAG